MPDIVKKFLHTRMRVNDLQATVAFLSKGLWIESYPRAPISSWFETGFSFRAQQ